uniref:Uncharacterized protein n=1 Tax=Micrurus corallinus TaxID=54390 RepID=A0A2D4FZE6_MICCO
MGPRLQIPESNNEAGRTEGLEVSRSFPCPRQHLFLERGAWRGERMALHKGKRRQESGWVGGPGSMRGAVCLRAELALPFVLISFLPEVWQNAGVPSERPGRAGRERAPREAYTAPWPLEDFSRQKMLSKLPRRMATKRRMRTTQGPKLVPFRKVASSAGIMLVRFSM